MPRLCCFLHPENTSDDSRALTDTCPVCSRPYGFALSTPPELVGDYRVIRPLNRGFYSAAYVAERGILKRKKVIKVAFKATYDYFNKNFEQECLQHARIAEGSHHIVGIDDVQMNVSIAFGGEHHECHYAVMDFVDGRTLQEQLASPAPLPARTIAQIAIDLFSILRELTNHQVHHNDLNPANLILQQLDNASRRPDAEDENVRLVAIDLNSSTDNSRSDPNQKRLGDLHYVVTHLRSLVKRLLPSPDATHDMEYRLASLLEERAYLLSPEATLQRVPTFEQCIDEIRASLRQVSSPWTDVPRLRRFDDAYNAQTLAPWFVPHLIVDPDSHWLSSISGSGPQVIIGMRGCGKTMLLRALQFHARATIPNGTASSDALLNRLKADGYVGIYASSTRLLDTVGTRPTLLHQPHARLFVAYAREALLALTHLLEIAPAMGVRSPYLEIANVVADYVDGAESIRGVTTQYELERQLHDLIVRLNGGDKTLRLRGHPSSAFPALAEAVRRMSPEVWGKATVFFLLDDVSTRFLHLPGIKDLMSSLLFSDTRCAFKITTESQTLETLLQSPGMNAQARAGRDYQVFDLGTEVNALIRSRSGMEFIEDVLKHRAKILPNHPAIPPRDVLGSTSLESIAEKIATTAPLSSERKAVYWGLSALRGVCVGDIGDAISLYELIIRKGTSGQYPVSPLIQSDCFQELCSTKIFELNRQKSTLKDCAQTFAEASHELLLRSQKDQKDNRKRKSLRQYARLFVEMTVGDTDSQFKQICALVDSGIFVLDGGATRSKAVHNDPVRQLRLTFRKLFGISKYIGLAERDRFELSGNDLIEWLERPQNGKSILLRNIHAEDSEEQIEYDEEVSVGDKASHVLTQATAQKFLEFEPPVSVANVPSTIGVVQQRVPVATKVSFADCKGVSFGTIVFGLGFEERTKESIRRLSSALKSDNWMAVAYEEAGQRQLIEATLSETKGSLSHVDYLDIRQGLFPALGTGRVLIDLTGLAKPAIFHSVRRALQSHGEVWIYRTRAEQYYPLDSDIESIFSADKHVDGDALLAALSRVLTGESTPYELDPMIQSDGDDTRRRVLCAYSSPKHERLLTLLDRRQYDAAVVFTQAKNSPRSRLAAFVAEIAARNYPATDVEVLASDDIFGAIQQIGNAYEKFYVNGGFNFEMGLTGSKLQTVACAAASVALKISQAWYVRPQGFDATRFTSGVGESDLYHVVLR